MIAINPNRLFLAIAMFGLLLVANCSGEPGQYVPLRAHSER